MNNKFFLNYITVDVNNLNQRIDNFLFSKIKNICKSKIYSLIRKGNIRVNKKRICYKYKLKINDIIRLPLININIYTNNIFLSKNRIFFYKKFILYEDNYLLVINKPSGISVHSGLNTNINIIDIYRNIYKDKMLNLIHRLDKYTSGVLLISKNRYMLLKLNNLFLYKKIIKKYILLVYGKFPYLYFKIKNFLIKYNKKSYIFKNKVFNSKEAITYIKLLKYINNFSLLEAFPVTGRFHQIRCQLSDLGYPVLYDNIYGNKFINKKYFIKGFSRLFLHCKSLCFIHPIYKKKIFIITNLDKKLCYILNIIKNI